jgi:hypothetical protein
MNDTDKKIQSSILNVNDQINHSKPTFESKILKFISPEIYAIIKLRFLLVYRNKIAFVYRFILPLPFIIFTIIFPKLFSTSNNYDPNVTFQFIIYHNFIQTLFPYF